MILALVLTPVAGHAQDAVAVAEGLFREGLELMQKGDVATACEKFAESQRLDPSSGTMLNLADCHEKQGKIATAWAEFLAAGRLAKSQGRPQREEEAKSRAAALEPKLSYLRIVLSEKIAGTTVKIDTVTLEASALGSKLPVDPGKRSVVISTPGYQSVTLEVTIGAEKDSQTLTVPKLIPEESGATPPGPKETSGPGPAPTPPGPDEPTAEGGPPVIAYVVGGVGVVALGVGTVFALMASSAYGEAEDKCPTRQGCSREAIDLRDKAETRANIANVGIGVGIVGIGVGTFLLLTSSSGSEKGALPSRERARLEVVPVISDTHAGLYLSGAAF